MWGLITGGLQLHQYEDRAKHDLAAINSDHSLPGRPPRAAYPQL